MMSMTLSDIAVLNIQGVDYCCIINGSRKSEAQGILNYVNPTNFLLVTKTKIMKLNHYA